MRPTPDLPRSGRSFFPPSTAPLNGSRTVLLIWSLGSKTAHTTESHFAWGSIALALVVNDSLSRTSEFEAGGALWQVFLIRPTFLTLAYTVTTGNGTHLSSISVTSVRQNTRPDLKE